MIDEDTIAEAGTFRRLAWDELSSPRTLRGHFGRRMMGLFALTADVFAEGVGQTVTMPWVLGNPPPDMLGPLGRDSNLPRYPTETNAQYQARLQRAWDDWEVAGTNAAIIGQLAAAGFPGAQIFRWGGSGSWSEFVLFFPEGTHTVTSPGPEIGSFVVGDGTIIGPTGITPVELNTIRGIIRQWKPGRWVCRKLVWEISGWTVGDSHTVGEIGLEIGGIHAEVGAI